MSLVKKHRIDKFRKNKRNMKKRTKELRERAKQLATLAKAEPSKPK